MNWERMSTRQTLGCLAAVAIFAVGSLTLGILIAFVWT